MSQRQNAVILNFTGNRYHWGCYGTAVEIYDTLVERGYVVTHFSVVDTHQRKPVPDRLDNFDDIEFFKQFATHNMALVTALEECDIVVVNGEGTLHRLSPGSLNLLYVMHVAARFLRKPVHLINHSFYPSGTTAPEEPADTLYRHVGNHLQRIVAREPLSAGVIRRLQLEVTQGFDCLPRYMERHGLARHQPKGYLCLAGGVSMGSEAAKRMAAAVARVAGKARPVRFLTGARHSPAAEDKKAFEAMRQVLPQLQLVTAEEVDTWVETIAHADCLISARFHHTIAAFAAGTPVVSMTSNTPKVEGICSLLEQAAPVPLGEPALEDAVYSALTAALDGAGGPASAPRETMLALAEANFDGLQDVRVEPHRRLKSPPPLKVPPLVPASSSRGSPHPVVPAKTGRNDPCPCGSEMKYKRCCAA